MQSSRCWPVALVCALLLVGGCATPPHQGPYASTSPAQRDTTKAEKITRDAVARIDTDPLEAEALLREALTADLFYGPAHNNLGVIHLGRGELYEAAHEFEWARKLMPGVADPRMNLALALERAGRFDEAMVAYEDALEAHREHIPTLQALCRLQLRHDRADDETDERLAQVATRGETEEWRSWAQRHMIMRREVIQ